MRPPQTATAGLVTLIPEGLVLLMSVTFAVAAVRLAKRDTLIQQMSATESLASVDTICVDKTGTLTEGELRLAGVEFADGRRPGGRRRGPGTLRGERRRPQPDPGDDRRALSRRRRAGRAPRSPSPPSGSGRASRWPGTARAPGPSCWARPTSSKRRARWSCRRGWRRSCARRRRPGGASSPSGAAGEALPDDAAASPAPRLTPRRPDRAGGDAARGRRRDDRLHARAGSRPEADLRRRGGDRDRGRLRGRRAARRGRGRGARPARRPGAPAGGRRSRTRSSAGSSRSRRKRWSRRWSTPGATWR